MRKMKLSAYNKEQYRAFIMVRDGLLKMPAPEIAGLNKKAVLIGQGKKFEIWDEDAWTESQGEWIESVKNGDDELPVALEELSL